MCRMRNLLFSTYYSKLLIPVFWLISVTLSSQVPVGSWRLHLPCNNAIQIAYAGSKVYCTTGESLFSYSVSDNSTEKLSKITGLSDFGASAIAYSPDAKLLVVGYENGNIDLVSGKKVYNISELKQKILATSKAINHILIDGKKAYLSCGFGILLLDLDKKEIKDTYIFGPLGSFIQVNSCAVWNDEIYAATANGLYKAPKNDPYLVDYSRWTPITSIPNSTKTFRQVAVNNNTLYAIYSDPQPGKDTVYYQQGTAWNKIDLQENTDAWNISFSNNQIFISTLINLKIFDSNYKLVQTIWQYGFGASTPRQTYKDANGDLWIADYGNGLVCLKNNGSWEKLMPNGPVSSKVKSFLFSNHTLYATSGGIGTSWDNQYIHGLFYAFQNEEWNSIATTEANVFDFLNMKADPKDKDLIYISTWGSGIYTFKNGSMVDHFNENNSTLQNAIPGGPFTRVYGMDFDKDGNLWVSNSGVPNALSVRKTNGEWVAYPLQSAIGSSSLGDVIIDDNNYLWLVLPRGEGLFVLDFKNTPDNRDDDRYIKFKPQNAYGSIVNNIYSIAKDLDGNIWVGTDNGPIVYTSPKEVFNGETNGKPVTIPRNDGTTNADPLLGNEIVHSIAVDGANRKWLGTDRGGVLLVSADGVKTIHQFNVDNSPILSNTVIGIGINDKTGEVFFGTDRGIISYRSDATKAEDSFGDIYAFPNPVRPNYEGLITITGLIKDANIKITDIGGNLVYETTTLGGSVTWDGRNFEGRKVATGVYLIFCTNADGTQTKITKLLFIK